MKKNKQYLVSLIDIFTGNMPDMKDYTNLPKSNYTIDTTNKTIRELLERLLVGLTPTEQLHELEKLAMKIRRLNAVKIEDKRKDFANTHPKIKEESNNYKR